MQQLLVNCMIYYVRLDNKYIMAFTSSITTVPINPLKPNTSNYYTLPYRPNLPIIISDIRTLWRSALSARVSECQKLETVGQTWMALNSQSVTV